MSDGMWAVSQADINPDYVELKISGIDEDGVRSVTVYFPPDDADALAAALSEIADDIRAAS